MPGRLADSGIATILGRMARGESILPGIILGLVAGGLVLFIAQLVLNPVPVSGATAYAAGAAGFFFMSADPARLIIALATAGGAAGVIMHRNVHLSGGSPPPPEGLLHHLGVEGGIGLGVALLGLLVAGAVVRAMENR